MGLMDMLGTGGANMIPGNVPMPNNLNNIIQQFGGIQNIAKQLNRFLGNKGMDPKQIVLKNLQGKHFSNETINQFRQFARQSGMSDEQIENGLRQAGILMKMMDQHIKEKTSNETYTGVYKDLYDMSMEMLTDEYHETEELLRKG